jgi:curli production assembly/transport component CsgG/holdfast attachment protein HfaB
LVERFDTSVTELELRYANNRLIGQEGAGQDNVRRIFAGQMPGSDYTFVGGITEMNYNIRSQGVDASAGTTNSHHTSGNIGGRIYVMNIALDFRLIDTRTLEVVDVISYQKQIVGHEVRAGVFNFFGDTFVDIAAGDRALEPVQLAVRAGVERAVVEVMSNLYRVSDSSVCQQALFAEGDPMGPGSAQATGNFASTQTGPALAAAAVQRTSPDAWHASRDANVEGLRGTTVVASAPPSNGPRAIAGPTSR